MKPVQLLVRIGLIGLLPLIALTLYVKGQRYDPALLDFAKTRSQEASGKAGQLPTIAESGAAPESAPAAAESEFAGFRRLGQERRYAKDNLYEHVDGHAEYFISAGFTGLTVTEYTRSGVSTSKPAIQAEVYDMAKDIQAFGVLIDESGDNAQAVSVGAMGFKTSGGINFIKGRYYVKITALEPKAPLMPFAKAFAGSLPVARASFIAFDRLPRIGTAGKTRFIKEGYRGLDFFNNVIEREYTIDSRKITLALVADSGQELSRVVSSFLEYVKKSGLPMEKSEQEGKTIYKLTDKYEGSWFLVASPNAVFAVFGTEDSSLLRPFMKIGDRGKDAVEKR